MKHIKQNQNRNMIEEEKRTGTLGEERNEIIRRKNEVEYLVSTTALVPRIENLESVYVLLFSVPKSKAVPPSPSQSR